MSSPEFVIAPQRNRITSMLYGVPKTTERGTALQRVPTDYSVGPDVSSDTAGEGEKSNKRVVSYKLVSGFTAKNQTEHDKEI